MRRAIYYIWIDGQDVTGNFEPYLIRLQIRLTDGGESDTCEISLDDSAGQLETPRDDADIEVRLQWSDGGRAVIFKGKTDEPESQGSRGGGMVMNITARATDMKDKPKEKRIKHKDDATFGDAAKEFGKLAGLNVKVSGEIAKRKRDYWAVFRRANLTP
jgi:phage protein D